MATTYYKRHRMELDLRRATLPAPSLPDGYAWVGWHASLTEAHATVKYECFRGEMDAHVFASLSDLSGCSRLMRDIAGHEGFLPAVTWLVQFEASEFHPPVLCGTIQGLRRNRRVGAIQNIGVVAAHRGFGLGRALLAKGLEGFRSAGLSRVTLEVTAANEPAIELYRRVGFRVTQTSYREVTTSQAQSMFIAT